MLSQSPPAILFERSPIILPTHKKATLPQRVSVQSLSSTQPDDLRLEKQDTYARLSATSKLPNTGSESDTYSLSQWLLEEGPLERLGVSGTLLDARHLQRPRPSPLSKPANSSFIGKKIQDMDNPVSYLAHIGSWCDDVKLPEIQLLAQDRDNIRRLLLDIRGILDNLEDLLTLGELRQGAGLESPCCTRCIPLSLAKEIGDSGELHQRQKC